MNKQEIRDRISVLESEVKPLLGELANMRQRLREECAKDFLIINQIKRQDIEFSSGADSPYFGTVYNFADWLRKNSNKNWAEWNSTIYRSSDLLAGRMPDMPASIYDLP